MTRTGQGRSHHTDQFLVADLGTAVTLRQSSGSGVYRSDAEVQSRATALLVADSAGGDGLDVSGRLRNAILASVGARVPWLLSLPAYRPDEAVAVLVSVVRDAIAAAAPAASDRKPLTTTSIVFACVVWPHLLLAHSGTSCCYLHRRGTLRQLTRPEDPDGLPAAEGEADDAPSERGLSPTGRRLRLGLGDELLLCSDGLTAHVSEDTIARLTRKEELAANAWTSLIDAAESAGAEDDITVVAAKIKAAPGAKEGR